MRLTPEILAACYELLRATRPFDRWGLPPASEVRFVSVESMSGGRGFADYTPLKRGHKIRVSEARHERLSRILETMAHEMCHVKQRCCRATRNSATHGKVFQRLADQVCKHHPDFERPVF